MTDNFKSYGEKIRKESKDLVYKYMTNSKECQKGYNGVTLAQIFRDCGFDWGAYKNTTSSNQQYWCVALIRELEKENKVERLESKKWRLK